MIVEQIVASSAISSLLSGALKLEEVKTWIVFGLCCLFSILGVGASFLILGTDVAGYRLWGISIVIAVGMIGLSYGQKYAKVESRTSFTPVDLISYLIQGFLWPTTWPTLAKAIGVSTTITGPVAPPAKTGASILESVLSMLS